MKRRFKGEMVVKAAWAVGNKATQVRTQSFDVGKDLPADAMGEVLAETLQSLRELVRDPGDVTLVVSFR